MVVEMKTDMVKYYYKDPDTGVEVTFSKTAQWGWAASFHTNEEEMFDMLLSDIKLPWPELSQEDAATVSLNYERLYEGLN